MFDVPLASHHPDSAYDALDRLQPLRDSWRAAVVESRQQTLRSRVHCVGVGLHSGAKTHLTLHPAEPGSGVRFRRSDADGGDPVIAALWSNVTDTRLNTCIGNEDGVSVRTVEHLMSALAGMGVDNVLIDIEGEEVPAMDGSAAPFVHMIEAAGLVRAGRDEASGVLRRYLDPLDLGQKGEGRRDDQRHLRVSDDRAEPACRRDSPEGDACDTDDARGDRSLDDGAHRGGAKASAASCRRLPQDRRQGR